ncbi:GGDEF domain-containing protein [Planomonospora sp. ID67723]|uniref:GGDEF domain-containing protein n=1 Tax=Planomonospora sp. ID67723 TaxID=2738134 RepID=UPI0018C43F91|nr:GGDEF domain-containing protein [Planomonospora sp. ID67723]MBG0833014.1 GGDEF domain-containing protein [Planomonospora sp. ID67723]
MNRSPTTATSARVPEPPRSRGLPAWICWLALGTALVGLHYALPLLGASETWQGMVYCLVSGGSAVAMAVGIRSRKPRAASAWWLMTASQVMFTAGDVSYYVVTALGDDADYSPLPNTLYLLQYPLMVLALMVLIRSRTPGRNLPAVIDAAIITVGAALLYWMFLIGPMVTASDMSVMERLATVAFPVMDLLVLTVALRLMFGGGSRGGSYHLLIGFLCLVLLTDTVYGLQTLVGDYVSGTWLDLGWLTGYLLLGATGLHPSMARLGDRQEQQPVNATGYRLALLASATLMVPVVLIVQFLQHGDFNLLMVASASTALFLLVLARMSGLLAAQRRLAMTDVLTGLHTRRSLQERMAREASRPGRRSTALGLLLVDVDHFKRVNDTYGHPAGDEVLTETARRILAACRTEDLAARFGGEEFAVLVPRATAEGLALLAERIRAAVADEPVTVGGAVRISVTVSVGGAVVPLHAATADELVQVADGALYKAKHSGRNLALIGPVAGGCDPADRRFRPAA